MSTRRLVRDIKPNRFSLRRPRYRANMVENTRRNNSSVIGKALVILLILGSLIWGGYFLYNKYTKKM